MQLRQAMHDRSDTLRELVAVGVMKPPSVGDDTIDYAGVAPEEAVRARNANYRALIFSARVSAYNSASEWTRVEREKGPLSFRDEVILTMMLVAVEDARVAAAASVLAYGGSPPSAMSTFSEWPLVTPQEVNSIYYAPRPTQRHQSDSKGNDGDVDASLSRFSRSSDRGQLSRATDSRAALGDTRQRIPTKDSRQLPSYDDDRRSAAQATLAPFNSREQQGAGSGDMHRPSGHSAISFDSRPQFASTASRHDGDHRSFEVTPIIAHPPVMPCRPMLARS